MNYLLVQVICCLVILGLSRAMPHRYNLDTENNELDSGSEKSGKLTDAKLSEAYAIFKRINEEEKRSRARYEKNIACQIYLPGSNCDHLQIPGMTKDDAHWREAGPGKR